MASIDRAALAPRILRMLVIACMVAIAGAIVVFGVSEWKLQRIRAVPPASATRPASPPDLAEGERMARILGCWAGCHGRIGQGGSIDMDGYYSVTAPTLSAVLPRYSDVELATLVRYGIKRDGRTALGMTSYTFFPLGDEDLANVTAHLRRQPAHPPVPRHRSITPAARLALARGRWQVAADQVDVRRPRWGELPRATAFERGRYLASITCSECHGVDFRGSHFQDNTYDGGPTLALVGMYGRDAFRTLLRTGVPIGGRDLGEMAWVAQRLRPFHRQRGR